MNQRYGSVAKWFAVGAAAGLVCSRLPVSQRVKAGQVAVITGGSRGLGLALAHRFGRAGVKLVLAATHEEELHDAREQLVDAGSAAREDVLLYACDLTDALQAEGLISFALERVGRLDILINNAGIIEVGPAGKPAARILSASNGSRFLCGSLLHLCSYALYVAGKCWRDR